MSTDLISGVSSSFSLNNTTQNSLLGSDSGGVALSNKEGFGAAVVSATLDKMNQGGGTGSDMQQTYDFNKTVLGGHAASLGAVTDLNI
ncbi:MAG: hypothetical protein AUJ49_07070 [Desulfovibrionaceae bacterium CG1_02_65_16]|nr:MAG: hypothetical protein AUJ49_07070 [Desulfovibrionaceae bacterium CG1_02_65_16]